MTRIGRMRRGTDAPFNRALGRLYATSAEAERVWHLLGDVWSTASAGPERTPTRNQVDAIIVDFLREVEEGRARAVGDKRYTREELRQLRAALIHITSELGTMSVEDVRIWDVHALIDKLRDAGLPASRLESVIDAIRSLYAYAVRRRLVATSPVPGLALVGNDRKGDAQADEFRTPTGAMVALGAEVITWTVRLIVIAFILIVIGLGRELGVVDAIPFP
jgi:hypothetical protein